MRKLLLAAAALTACAGCNTVAGVGRDLQAVGKVMTGTADDSAKGLSYAARNAGCPRDQQGRVDPARCAKPAKVQAAKAQPAKPSAAKAAPVKSNH